jgi:hypothetical protein
MINTIHFDSKRVPSQAQPYHTRGSSSRVPAACYEASVWHYYEASVWHHLSVAAATYETNHH